MARVVIVAIGGVLLFLGIIAYFYPIPNTGFTIPMADEMCTGDWVQWALMYTQDVEALEACNMFGVMTFAIYGISLIGIILIIVGAVKKSNKSSYVCEHCHFIGFTEEVLWNHYNEKHPDEKKW